jgi:transcription antitermination protein NusB
MNQYSRRKARKLAVQAIYQWQITQDPIDHIAAQFLAEANPKKIDIEYFAAIVKGVANSAAELDKNIEIFLDRKLSELDLVELAVLRLAVYEFLYKPDVPYKVVIDEALDLTKLYGSVEGFKYVNGILDKVAKVLRCDEVAAVSKPPKKTRRTRRPTVAKMK